MEVELQPLNFQYCKGLLTVENIGTKSLRTPALAIQCLYLAALSALQLPGTALGRGMGVCM